MAVIFLTSFSYAFPMIIVAFIDSISLQNFVPQCPDGSTSVWGPGTILCLRPANEIWRYNVMSCLIGWAHTKNYSLRVRLWLGPNRPQDIIWTSDGTICLLLILLSDISSKQETQFIVIPCRNITSFFDVLGVKFGMRQTSSYGWC